jgi:hypothetical protein
MLYGTLFMMAGAYTLATGGHVRGDVLYGFFSPRTQATLDLILYFVFFIPGVLALCWAGWDFASESWVINEHSSVSADGPPIYPFKAIIPLAGGVLMLQGVVEILRCIVCIQQGSGPRAPMTWKKSTSRSCATWCTPTCRKATPQGARNEKGTPLRLRPDGDHHRGHRHPDAGPSEWTTGHSAC